MFDTALDKLPTVIQAVCKCVQLDTGSHIIHLIEIDDDNNTKSLESTINNVDLSSAPSNKGATG